MKDEAKELLSKMDVKHHIKLGPGSSFPVSMYDSQIKQCTITCVREMIELSCRLEFEYQEDFSNVYGVEEYLHKLLEEVEKL